MSFLHIKDLRVHLNRSSQRGGSIRVTAASSFAATLSRTLGRVTASIISKLDDFFGLSEYDWTPKTREDAPSMYLYELVNWLTTVVDSLVIKDAYKEEAYKGAVDYIAQCFMVSPFALDFRLRYSAVDINDLSIGLHRTS